MAQRLPGIKEIINPDEFGHFYSKPPNRTIVRCALPGCKKQKERLTFLSFANAAGSEKLLLMIIGMDMRPLPIKCKTGAELGFDHHADKEAWMTTTLFFAWLKILIPILVRRKVVK